MTVLTKESIQELLQKNDKAVAHALVVLFKNQTATEQNSESTINRNGEGFRPAHARVGTSMANFYMSRNFLTPKQVAYWRRPMKDGNSRIGIYWRQLIVAAKAKAKAAAASAKDASYAQYTGE